MAVRTGELAATCDLHVLDAERVARVREHMEPEPIFHELAEIFAAMGDPTRVKIIFALSHSELCVCDLATLLGVSVSAVSHQFRLLRSLRIVKYRREGRLAYYSLDDHHITTLLNQGLEHVGDRVETRAGLAAGGVPTKWVAAAR